MIIVRYSLSLGTQQARLFIGAGAFKNTPGSLGRVATRNIVCTHDQSWMACKVILFAHKPPSRPLPFRGEPDLWPRSIPARLVPYGLVETIRIDVRVNERLW